MYQAENRELMGHRLIRQAAKPRAVVDFVPRPAPIFAAPPSRPWTGRFMPAFFARAKTLGALADGNDGPQPDDVTNVTSWAPEGMAPLAPRTVIDFPTIQAAPTLTPTYQSSTPTPSNAAASSAWDTFFSGISKVATPAAQALLGIKTTGMIQQQQQKTLAATWNPALTGPALQAQAYQNAYNTGTGSGLPISMGTLALLGAGALALMLIAKK